MGLAVGSSMRGARRMKEMRWGNDGREVGKPESVKEGSKCELWKEGKL